MLKGIDLPRASRRLLLAVPLVVFAYTGTANAQCSNCTNEGPKEILLGLIDQTDSDYLTQSPQNLMMMQDNPAYFVVDDGKDLFQTKRGPNDKTLQQCDFGKGPGVLEGAYVELPKYFEDTGRVMDLESRLVYCMKTIQGFSSDAPEMKNRADIRALMAYVAAQSNGYAWAPSQSHPMERAMRNAGEEMFYRQSGKLDFSCATCHTETGQRIRASVLPNINNPKEWTKAISWPALRVGKSSNIRSPYQRLRGCYWQMRKGRINRQSDAAIAMFSFWKDAARGEPAILPDLKR